VYGYGRRILINESTLRLLHSEGGSTAYVLLLGAFLFLYRLIIGLITNYITQLGLLYGAFPLRSELAQTDLQGGHSPKVTFANPSYTITSTPFYLNPYPPLTHHGAHGERLQLVQHCSWCVQPCNLD
jgi:hypothetical protein